MLIFAFGQSSASVNLESSAIQLETSFGICQQLHFSDHANVSFLIVHSADKNAEQENEIVDPYENETSDDDSSSGNDLDFCQSANHILGNNGQLQNALYNTRFAYTASYKWYLIYQSFRI